MKVLVLGGGDSNEREISLRSASAVRDALTDLGHDVGFNDTQDGFDGLKHELPRYEIVMPILHGEGGEDGQVQKVLEVAGAKFLGSGSRACELSFDKYAFKTLLNKHHMLTPKGAKVTSAVVANHPLAQQPFVLKPVTGGSSIHTFIERRLPVNFERYAEAFTTYNDTMLLEELIEGTEITVGVLDDQALPVVEIIPPEGSEFDYENKYNGATAELCPPRNVSPKLQQAAQRLAEDIHRLLGARHLSRTDMMVRGHNIYVLETNTIPGLTNQSLFPKAAEAGGLTWHALVAKFVELAAAR
jgi:D-alanine-D-alanine ligase